MRFVLVRLSLICGVLIAIAGCGGGATGGSSTVGGGNPATVTIAFKGSTPAVVAARVGSGGFSAQTLSSNTLTLSIPSGTSNFAVAFLCTTNPIPPFQTTEQTVLELSVADGTSFTVPCGSVSPQPGAQTGTLTGSVDASGIPGAASVGIVAQNGATSLSLSSAVQSSFSFAAPAGNDRVDVLAYDLLPGSLSQIPTLVAARDFPSQAVPGALNGGNPVVLGPGDKVTLQPITYANVPAGLTVPSTLVNFETGGGGGFAIAQQATTQYPNLPAGAVESGDRYLFLATAFATMPTQGVSVEKTSAVGGPVSLTFPVPWTYGGPAPARLPTFDFAYSGFSGRTGVIQEAAFGATGGTFPIQSNYFLIIASANSQNGMTTLTYPDLSGLAGFLAAPASGTQVFWSAQIVQSSSGVMQPVLADLTVSGVSNGGYYVVP